MVMVLSRITLLLLFAVAVRVQSQFDSNGFLSIDCGAPASTTYIDKATGLTYISDDQFIDTGNSSKISPSVANNSPREYFNVRYFPNGIRNCFTIPLKGGTKYLVRATFIYGNYDNSNNPPIFDLYLGVNFWYTVDTSQNYYYEIMINANNDYLEVCLVNSYKSNPFISSIHLRKLQGRHPYVNSTQSLALDNRANIGASNRLLLRYPDDINDRWWWNYTYSGWKEISSSSTITVNPDADFKTPSLVLQTACTTSSTEEPLSFYWESKDISTVYYFILHFYEIQTPLTGRREFNILINGILAFNTPTIPGIEDWLFTVHSRTGFSRYNISLVATQNSTLPPLLNAFELFVVTPVGIPTFFQDVSAINNVKEYHNIKKGWSGDPCLPRQFVWTGITCTSDTYNITRITHLNLSHSLLSGSLSVSFSNLTALEYLDLSNNNLSGSLPSSLSSLTALKLLDIRGNPGISTILPSELERKRKDGSLEYRYGNMDSSPSVSPSKKNVTIIAIAVAVPLLVVAIIITIVFVLKREKHKRSIIPSQNESYQPNPQPRDCATYYTNIAQEENPTAEPQKQAQQFFPKFENRTFSYDDLKKITTDFKNKIGTGGYGIVYSGHLENGLQVAVKMLSQTSHQGVKEFLAEAKNLSRVHHRNLVALMGYCTDKRCMALIYEYMQEGNLYAKLKDKTAPLSWKQRLQIAYESALGLEYLHKACNPPLVHRDVKTSNILLNENLEAKIADFGLSRSFDNNLSGPISTRIVGTVGYLDPEYYLTNQLSAKSDVFSFGVVMLEIVTGKSPTGAGIEGGNLVQWVRHKLSAGDIETIVDPKIQDKYDINSVWKVVDLACRCTEPTSSRRPTMSAIVAELKETLDLEMSMEEMHNERSDNSSQNITIEMAHFNNMPLISPSVR